MNILYSLVYIFVRNIHQNYKYTLLSQSLRTRIPYFVIFAGLYVRNESLFLYGIIFLLSESSFSSLYIVRNFFRKYARPV